MTRKAALLFALLLGAKDPEPPPDVTAGAWSLIWLGADWSMELRADGGYSCRHEHLPPWEGSWLYDRGTRTLHVWDRALYPEGKGAFHVWSLRLDRDMKGTARLVAGPLAGRSVEASLRKKGK